MFGFWSRRSFWDKAEWIFAGLTALAGATATSLAACSTLAAGWRVGAAAATFLFAFAVAGCKLRAKVLDNEQSGCRGLVGQVWFTRTTRSRVASCDWPTDGNQNQKEVYATSLEITLAEAEAMNVKSQTLIAAPIEVNGERWGVLVLDCRERITLTTSGTSAQSRILSFSAEAIGCILREANP